MSEVVNQLITASHGWAADSPGGAMMVATRAFLSEVAQDGSLLGEAAVALGHVDTGSAAWIAVVCGMAVEKGAPADVSGPAVFELMRSWLPLLPSPGKENEPATRPTAEQESLLMRFRYVCQAVVTHLARLSAQREAMGYDNSLILRLDELGALTPGAIWVREALLKTSGTVVLLHATSGTGLRLSYTNVSNCFHLFSLLQTAVGTGIEGGRQPSDDIAKAARGKNGKSVSDEAWWHYGSVLSPKADVTASIWGEGLVREIPRVDGEQIILLWPPLLQSRTWDGGFLGPHLDALPADAVVERMLTEEECGAWLRKLEIGEAAQPAKQWWRFW